MRRLQALQHGDQTAARRALWVRLVRWHRDRAAVLYRKITEHEALAAKERADLARGTVPPGRKNAGKPYAELTVKAKASAAYMQDAWAREARAEADQLATVTIPTYREWCALTGFRGRRSAFRGRRSAVAPPRLVVDGVEIRPEHFRAAFPEWYRLAIKYEWRMVRERDELECARARREKALQGGAA